METIVRDKALRNDIRKKGLDGARAWMKRSSSINKLLDEATQPGIAIGPPKINKVLFAQHSSGGDVLMTTQCFKGIKERHPGMDLVYMTQSMYRDIVEGNPYIDELLEDWDEELLKKYVAVYNPHGEKILPGGWNNLDVTLHSLYPYFCKVEADEMYIELVDPQLDPGFPETSVLREDYIVVQTAGQQKRYRTYKHMDAVIQMMPDHKFVQLGMGKDLACHGATLDLREKLSWRESAHVMKNAKAAVVIDSFLSHLAGVLNTPVVVLYGPAPARVTGPRGQQERIINLEPNKLDVCPITSNCWGHPGKNQCTSPCINTLNPMHVVKALQEFLKPKEAFGI
jgi:ADP-heptose:LPS heptosyltransferase